MVLDVEKPIRMSDKEHHLNNMYAQSDGLHLMRKAYDDALDRIGLPVINRAINNNPKR